MQQKGRRKVVYSSRSSFEEDSAGDRQREEDRARRDLEASKKFEKFFKDIGASKIISNACAHNWPKKIQIVYGQADFVIQHRGHEIRATCADLESVEPRLRIWCEKEMPHAKVFPRKPPHQ